MTDRASLGHWVRRFLMEYAASERNLSANTRESYRDMLVLLLPFAASTKSTSIDKLAVTDLSADTVRAFLAHLENERRCSTATRNQRLASIHALARFIGMLQLAQVGEQRRDLAAGVFVDGWRRTICGPSLLVALASLLVIIPLTSRNVSSPALLSRASMSCFSQDSGM
jgi:integrase